MLDPAAGSVAETIKAETGGRGADVCIEVSGAAAALAEAIRTVAYSSRVVAMGFFQGEARGLMLGEEFHHNRIELDLLADLGRRARCESPLDQAAIVAERRSPAARRPAEPAAAHHAYACRFAEAPALFARIDAGEPGMLQSVLTFGSAA